MTANIIYFASAALIGAAWIATPHGSQAGSRKVQLSLSGPADSCASLQVRSNGEVARATEKFTAPKGTLEIDAQSRGVIRVTGSDRPDFEIEVCRMAAAEDRVTAERDLNAVTVTRSGGRFTESGPAGGEWVVYFIVRAPRDGALDLETRNGPISVRDVTGRIRARAGNGPISLDQCGGDIQARATNGPIQFSGSGGNVSLAAQNGPVSVKLSGQEWQGSLLEARTVNGPVSLNMPDGYRSGVLIETSGHSPIACRLAACQDAQAAGLRGQRSLRLNGANPIVRLSTENGPVSVKGDSRLPKII